MNNLLKLSSLLLATAVTAPMIATPAHAQDSMSMSQSMAMGPKTGAFKGPEVNGGTATLEKKGGKYTVKLSPDFKIPASPAPHFQVVDGDGNTYLLQRLTIIGDKTHREVTLPKYIKSVKTVQIYCAFAEVVLGEASFDKVQSTK